MFFLPSLYFVSFRSVLVSPLAWRFGLSSHTLHIGLAVLPHLHPVIVSSDLTLTSTTTTHLFHRF
jgi:hypothetical protein